ncbi:zinc-dependent metalloprotease [Litorimonas haliclonae]|uniref:zinc-dependent metalloprotease n=1 Tax=Litorimonas haliclonae TaxID=2081977 RepID=UPI0039EEB9B9
MRAFLTLIAVMIFASCTRVEDHQNPMAGLEKRDGFLELYIHEEDNRVLVKLPRAGKDGVALRLIHTARLTAGLGSNPVGLDRGWGDSGKIIVFRRMGNKVIIEAENMTYRAGPENPLEQRAVQESFARSFLASADIVDGTKRMVDLTDFLTSDVLGLTQYLKDGEHGTFTVAKDRTLVDTKNVFAFPDNVEVDVFFTLSSDDPGREVATTAANGKDATLIQHHSFVRLPEEGYTPLKSDPRAGAIEEVHYDYSAALSEPIETRFARRYRLEKNEAGEVIKPIVFYIDSGAPEPIRSALIEGARWWEDAFEAAGYENGYRVEVLPEDAHPLDIRYNIVQWVHRQTRGWSYGGGVSDPRTGEMIKGHVNLGSLRVRQDRMIFEGLAGVSKTDSGDMDDPVELALARIRQLSAHEVGHALGFAHNFAASTYGKGSVMDYPAPDVRVTNGQLDFSKVYGVGVGVWDKFAATWLYGDMTLTQRDELVQDALLKGLVYVADTDARAVGTAHPLGNIWDNGANPVNALNEALAVRRIALDNFGLRNIQDGQPVSDLNKVIVPIYLYHRYQTAAAGKLIGGVSFNYGLKGDGQSVMEVVETDRQKEALDALLKTLDPAMLDLKDETLALLGPSLASYSIADSDRELFERTAYPAFDISSAADTAAAMTFDVLLDPRRVARLVEFNRRDSSQLGFTEMMRTIEDAVMKPAPRDRTGEIAKVVQARYVFSLMDLSNSDVSPGIKARTDAMLRRLQDDLSKNGSGHGEWLVTRIEEHLNKPAPAAPEVTESKPLPPGGPIGMGELETCWHC